ncbi:hypothetical protein BKA62DRAFT_645562 [Auriculariales sp. MPI-PUGE-AT-0066]|nr:hypothetical protein BKA62DRAFT_645562 [Auriculariales sp. MPI-PUGE-AT-0066]
MKFLHPITRLATALALLAPTQVRAGIIAYGLCRTGCNVIVMGCYGAAGAVFGTVLAVTASPTILACNGAQGLCMTTLFAPLLLTPVP